MKKVALSLLSFALVAGLAVAQDAPTLKLSGTFRTGAQIQNVDGNTETTLLESDSGKVTRIRIDGQYANANSGVTFRLQTLDGAAAPTFAFAYAWSKFAGDLVTVKVGKVDDGTFETAGDIGDDVVDGSGAVVIVKPAAGLALALTTPFNTASDPAAVAFSAAYSVDKLFSVQAGLKLAQATEFSSATTYTYKDLGLSDVVLGAKFVGVDKLSIGADTHISNLGASNGKTYGDTSKYAFIKVSQTASFAATDAVSINWLSYEFAYGKDWENTNADGKTPFGFYVKPNVDYKVSDLVTVNGAFKYAKGAQDLSKDAAVTLNDAAFIELKPSATWTLSPSATLVTGVAYDLSLDKKKLAYGTVESQVVANVDFRYSF